MTRDEKIDALLALFTCPNCIKIRMLDYDFNGIQMCRDCQNRANAGYPPKRAEGGSHG